ncbi:helix-turn-helix domain-containing protein [Streptomyces sp. MMS21 TC-5]|uniref:helix-turn-helix domain-containing protein n=1 Tax=Streptomyces sp. MMS21 TC-5 TaxID=2925833 RepID=UPI001F6190FF|nr:helix-turn-helix transcriptional regulator [Streptomyces sp. MMS21 TC-5]MCI4085658.1 helix-turn-helix domain-containing protein [Streptomyces sp. MMS21 TC-5]
MMANEALRRFRNERRWTQAQAAEQVCAQVRATTGRDPELDANWISRLERGAITWPSGDYRAALCAVFQVDNEAVLGLHPKGATPHSGTPHTLGTSAAPADDAGSIIADAELSARLARHAAATNVNALVLEQLDADLERLARDFVSRPLTLLIPEIRTLRTEVFRLVEGRQHPHQTRHLYVVAGWLSGLAAHVSLDLGHQPSAATHARTVVQCAEIAEHPRLRAWARSFQSLASYWTGDYRRAADLARSGYEDGRGPGSGTITARLLSLEARALAAGGDRRSALRSLALAHEARAIADLDELPGVFAFPEAKQWAYTGTTLLAVGGDEQVQRAITASTHAVELYQTGPEDDRSPGDLHAAHLDLATAYLANGQVDVASAELDTVLVAEQYTASITIRLRKLDTLIASGPYRDSRPVVDLREHIHEVTSRPAITSTPTEPR